MYSRVNSLPLGRLTRSFYMQQASPVFITGIERVFGQIGGSHAAIPAYGRCASIAFTPLRQLQPGCDLLPSPDPGPDRRAPGHGLSPCRDAGHCGQTDADGDLEKIALVFQPHGFNVLL